MSRRLMVFLTWCVAMTGRLSFTQQAAPAQSAADAKHLELLTQTAADYSLFLGQDRAVELQREAKPILKWTNPLRETPAGAAFLWTAKGRPHAIACIYTYGEASIDHEFQSLTAEPLQGRYRGKVVWEPTKPGIEPQRIPRADKPGDSTAVRLGQMRSLAKRYQASAQRDQDRHELRLLPQPVFRFAGEGAADGALFAFVQATDPELLLLIETRPTKTDDDWHYSLARMTDHAVDVRLDERVVWSTEAWDWRTRSSDQTYIKFTRTVRQ